MAASLASPSVSAASSSCYGAANLTVCSTKAFVARKKSFHGAAIKLSSTMPGSLRFSPLSVKATTSEETATDVSKQVEDIVADLKTKWDGVENKSTVLVYTGGAAVALWLSSTIVGAINSVPLLPKVMELVGLGYTGWFVYRYLLFKSSRKELVEDIEELKKKITGASE